MIQWVVEAARKTNLTETIVVATPDQEIIDACAAFGADARFTSPDHPSGTDRIAELAHTLQCDIYVNVQGDEPLVEPSDIIACVQPLIDDPGVMMGSIMADCPQDEEEVSAVVKVVTDLSGNALYFSRYAIPFPRNERIRPLKKHVGLYAYRHEALMQFQKWEQTPLEQTESLEQLRFLENGIRIRMSQGQGSVLAVDTPEQAQAVRKILEANQ